MPLAGAALLALWNDVRAGREAEYDRWHTVEHVPERVAVRGMLGARRYVNRARTMHRYFTLYELASLDVLDADEYRDLVEHPTPWSASMRVDFENFLRVPCSVTGSHGNGIGAAVAVLCLPPGSKPVDPAKLVALDGVVAAHAATGTPARGPGTWQADGPRPALRAFDRMLLVETLDRDAAARVLAALRTHVGLDEAMVDFGADVYDLAFALPGHDAQARRRHRRAHWARDE